MNSKPANVDEYISSSPEAAQVAFKELRSLTASIAPDAVEAVSCGLPSFKYRGRGLFHFGAAKNQ